MDAVCMGLISPWDGPIPRSKAALSTDLFPAAAAEKIPGLDLLAARGAEILGRGPLPIRAPHCSQKPASASLARPHFGHG
ncbi:MAG: hypothetical protein M0C28_35395 [Candidatus Moduliflexus flocculans]|nr:hypothetical protein [Candidatus Moduliflexus flocculans]